jgi:ribonuclease HI
LRQAICCPFVTNSLFDVPGFDDPLWRPSPAPGLPPAPIPLASPIAAATDGSALGNPGPGGWCWYVDDGRWAAGAAAQATNNVMELTAVLELLKASAAEPDRPVDVRADSTYVISALTRWIHGWRRKGWRTATGAPVANRELIEAISTALDGRRVTFTWVKGHSGHDGNEAADARARSAAEAVRAGDAPPCGPGWS